MDVKSRKSLSLAVCVCVCVCLKSPDVRRGLIPPSGALTKDTKKEIPWQYLRKKSRLA